MEIRSIFVNLPIRDVKRTREFWSKMGFGFNEQFSDEKAVCLILKENEIYCMLITHEFFKTFTNREIANEKTTQVLLAIDVESKEKVDELVSIALSNGATRYRESEDHGWMYYDTFADPDGHQWEILHADPTKIPQQTS